MNLLDDKPNEPSKFKTKNLVEINGDSRWTYNTNSQIEFKTMALNSSLCDYSDVKTLVKGTITVPNTAATDAAGGPNDREKIIFKSCAPFTDYINKTNSTQVNNTRHWCSVANV